MDHAAFLFPMGLFLFGLVHQPGCRDNKCPEGIAQRHQQHHQHSLPAEDTGIAEVENIQPSEEEITEEIQKMADAYKMEADKIREAIGESGLEQMKKDMAVQKAVTVIADAAVEVEKAADAE